MSETQGASALARDQLDLVASLRLPCLEDKNCLSFGPGSDVLCGYALHAGAESAVGVLHSPEEKRRAESLFPHASFTTMGHTGGASLEGLGDAYDLITLQVSADDAAEASFFETLVDRAVNRLSPNGLLVMRVPLAIDPDHDAILTRRQLIRQLKGYAWKVIGRIEDPDMPDAQWHIVHVTRMKPYVYMLLDEPGSGKSTLMRQLFHKVKIRRISGDKTYQRICNGKYAVSPELRHLIQEEFSTETIGRLTKSIIAQGLFDEVVDVWVARSGGRSFVLDSYVPETHRQVLSDLFADKGYFPVLVAFPSVDAMPSAETSIRKSNAFRLALFSGSAGVGGAGKVKKLASRLVKWRSSNMDQGK